MHRKLHNLIRRAESDIQHYGRFTLDTAALLNEHGINIENLEQQMLNELKEDC